MCVSKIDCTSVYFYILQTDETSRLDVTPRLSGYQYYLLYSRRFAEKLYFIKILLKKRTRIIFRVCVCVCVYKNGQNYRMENRIYILTLLISYPPFLQLLYWFELSAEFINNSVNGLQYSWLYLTYYYFIQWTIWRYKHPYKNDLCC